MPYASTLTPHRPATRIIAAGSSALMDGFRLAGIEVLPDASQTQLEELIKSLLNDRENVLLLVEDALAANPGPWMQRALSEGGRVVLVQVPSLASAGAYQTDVDRLIHGGQVV